ncbi:FHA domain-containing protein [Cryptosporangium aurantiacum]|nr:FHA domain-containing protein [Cryptosporangium aurantiacum]
MQPGEVCETCFISPVPRPEPVAGNAPAPASAGPCADPDCVNGGSVPASGCGACGASARAAGGAKLLFPWGVEELSAGGGALRIGREDSPLAIRLADYGNVSRRHAELMISAGMPVVVDLGSANGTFVNGERIVPREPRVLRHGDNLQFARDLQATIDLGSTR